MITIQNAAPEDVVENSHVFLSAWIDTYPNEEMGILRTDIEEHFKNSFLPEVLEKKKEQIRNLTKNEKYFNAKDNEKVIGVCRLKKYPEAGKLLAIYILAEYRGQGIGKLFWQEAIKFFDSDKEIIVNVVTYNKRAINFYEKLGFVDTGKRFFKDNFKINNKIALPEMEMRRRPTIGCVN